MEEHLLALLSEDKLEQVINELQNFIKDSGRQESLIIQSARLKDLENQINRGIIDNLEAAKERNRIRYALIAIIKNKTNHSEFRNNTPKRKMTYLVGIVLFSITAIFIVLRNNGKFNEGSEKVDMKDESTNIEGDQINMKDESTYIEGDQINNIINDETQDIRNFKQFVPKSYLNNLPKVKYNAHIEAHEYWDSGVTMTMLEGNVFLTEKLKEILYDLAKTAYTKDYFEGKTVEDYFSQITLRLSKAFYDSKPLDGRGSMDLLDASLGTSEIIDEFIVKIVKDVAEPNYFKEWKKKWDLATELGIKGKIIDLDSGDIL